MEEDVQDVFIESLAIASSGAVEVVDERGRRFKVDPRTRHVTGG
jgi:hypothetical protein